MHKHNLKCVLVTLSVAMVVSVFSNMQTNVAAMEEVTIPVTKTEKATSAVVRLDRSVGIAIQQKREMEVAADLQKKMELEQQAAQRAEQAKKAAEAAKKAAEAKKNASIALSKSNRKSSQESVPSNSNAPIGQAAVSAARGCIGIPYGASRYGTNFDCSGLTQYAYSKAGVRLCHSSAGQYSACRKISRGQLQVGDLVFWGSSGRIDHVGIYSGGGKVIDASPSGVVERAIYNTSSQHVIGYGRPY